MPLALSGLTEAFAGYILFAMKSWEQMMRPKGSVATSYRESLTGSFTASFKRL